MAKFKLNRSGEIDQQDTCKKGRQARSQFEQDFVGPGSGADWGIPPLSAAAAILGLQQTCGNRYVRQSVDREENIAGEESDSSIISQSDFMRGQGNKLPGGLQQRAENILGVDLENVRVHADPAADRLVSQAGALAFTLGQDIFIRESIDDRYSGGSAILAHEVVHTVQQRYGSGTDPENEAESVGRQVMNGGPADLSSGAKSPVPVLQRAGGSKGRITVVPPTCSYFEVTGTLSRVEMALEARGEWGKCTYRFEETAHGNAEGTITSCDIRVTNAILLPQWTGDGASKAPPKARAEFNRMLGCLRKHEMTHAQKAAADAPTFQQNFIGNNVADSESLHSREIARHKADIQDAYDDETSHGENEGVTLDTTTDPRTSLSEGGYEETTGPESEYTGGSSAEYEE